ncbi:MAG: SpoIID/LytB domain-containing protein, partial [Rubrivivax sp.]|nr:SpoIID/LytB domain-containing protein [Pyrinomonadaceae bacterium]
PRPPAPGPRPLFLPSRLRAHGLAHVCVCAFVLLAWSLPGVIPERRSASVVAPLSEDDVDAELQRAATRALGGREGTVLVLDAQTGRVRALAGGHAAFAEATPPGSTIKPFTMLTALRAGSLSEESHAFCRGSYRRDDFKIACAHPRYNTAFGPSQALANSCNYFFARAAESIDGAAYARTLDSFGFGAGTRGEEGDESTGQLPHDPPRVPEMLGESESLRVTPAQLATSYAALFNGGRLLAPLRARAEGYEPRERARVAVAPRHRALILAGMRGAVAYGTASRTGMATLPIYVFGKTGTSTPQDDWRAQGWFVGLAAAADSDEERAAPDSVRLVVLVHFKRSRGSEAAEAARPVFEAYAHAHARQSDSQLAGQSADEDSTEAALSSSTNMGGAKVRVRLSRGDATLTLPLDDYIFGVLAAEGSVETEIESLKALAVVSRNYALKNLRRHARDHFDLCDTTHCQRFIPVPDEGARPEFYDLVRRAVRETAGEVLQTAAGRTAEVYFSASCGGRTADVAKLWGMRDAPAHLRGVRDEFCAGAGAPWTDVIPSARLIKALRADERSDTGARLDAVRVLRRDSSGRAQLVALEGERRRILSGWDFKIIVGRTLGWSVLKSSRFEVERAGASFVFHGTGFGHGLGLCQTGAHVMASRGASYRQILAQYFPGTNVEELRNADFVLRIDESGAFQPRPASTWTVVSETSRTIVEGEHVISQIANDQPASYGSQPATVMAAIRNPQSAIRNRVSSEHFRVSYPARGARREVESVLRALEAAHADVSRRLERAALGSPPSMTEVTIHETTGDFVGATGRPAWVAATTTGRRIEMQPVETLRRRGVLAATLRHEFVHVALEAQSGGRAPLWLVEGLAVFVAGEGPALARGAPKLKVTLEELEQKLAQPASAREMRALYAAAFAEVGALVRRDGESSVWRRVARS